LIPNGLKPALFYTVGLILLVGLTLTRVLDRIQPVIESTAMELTCRPSLYVLF